MSNQRTLNRRNLRYTVLGSTQDITVCDCCSRQVKATVILNVVDKEIDGDQGERVFFGKDCAATAVKFNDKKVKDIKNSFTKSYKTVLIDLDGQYSLRIGQGFLDNAIDLETMEALSFNETRRLIELAYFRDDREQLLARYN